MNYKKEYQVINNSEIVLETRKPKWYSSEVNFLHNDKNYKIKKIKFWSMSHTIFELERPIGEIDLSYMKGGVIKLKNNNIAMKYSVTNSIYFPNPNFERIVTKTLVILDAPASNNKKKPNFRAKRI